ncbi:MAG: hypothetical protein H6742_11560 [Alphaproteobacteria bacterium]|nr:hypothetical protein [Alphaproteobacteria bacterium]
MLTAGDAPIRLAFVAEGFADEHQGAFQAGVRGWLDQLWADPETIPGRAPQLYEAWTVFPHGQRGRTVDNDVDDTALGGRICEAEGWQGRLYSIDKDALALLERESGLDPVDAWVVVFADANARANTLNSFDAPFDGEAILTSVAENAWTLDHELGHALVSLADEYSKGEGAFDEDPVQDAVTSRPWLEHWALTHIANLTSDPLGRKWPGLALPPEPGGWAYDAGIYHPTASCRMLQSDRGGPFCPVCNREIDRWHAAVQGNDGPPDCDLTAHFGPDGGVLVEVHARDLDGVGIQVDGAIDDGPLWFDPTTLQQRFVDLAGDPTTERTLTATCTDTDGRWSAVRAWFPADAAPQDVIFERAGEAAAR